MPLSPYSWPTSITAGVTTGEVVDTLAVYDRLAKIIGGWAPRGPLVAPSTAPQAIQNTADYVCDGTADQVDINAAYADSSAGQEITLLPGIYEVNAPIVRKPSRTLTGLGPGWLDQTIIKVANGSSANFQSASGHSGVLVPESWDTNATVASAPEVVANLTIAGNKANNATGQHHGLVVYAEFWGKYRNIRSYENRRSGIAMLTTAKNGVATAPSGLSDSQFENIWVNLNDEHGFYQDTPSSNHTDVVWSGSNRFFDNAQSGIWCDHPAGWEFNNLHLSNNGQHSVYFLDASFAVKINGLYSENHGTAAAAGVTYFGLRAPIANGEPLQVLNATIRTVEPAGTSTFLAFALEGIGNNAHAYLTNCHAMSAGTSRGRGFSYNAGSGNKLIVHESGVGTADYLAGQAREVIGVGTVINAAEGYVRKTADESVTSSTALQDDNHLLLAVEANTTYQLTGYIAYDGATTGDLLMGWSGPAGATLDWTPNGLTPAAAGTGGEVKRTRNTIADSEICGALGTGTANDAVALPTGLLTVGATAGTVTFRWAQGTSSATATTVLAGSWLRVKRVA